MRKAEKMGKRSREKSKLVLWALDPYEEELSPKEISKQIGKNSAIFAGLEIQPVYVASLRDLDTERGVFGAVPAAQKLLSNFVKSAKIECLRSPEVLVSEGTTQASSVKCLLEYAENQGAVSILVSSHGRSGVGRLIYGSFTENLLRESNLPIFFLERTKKKAPVHRRGKTVLFPTDFSQSSERAFHRFLPHAADMKFKIVLFHSIGLPIDMFPPGLPSVYVPENYFPEQESEAREASASWIVAAKKIGVNATLVTFDRGIGLVTGGAILKGAAENNAELIAMVSRSGLTGRILMGSAAYDVFRAGDYPVWLYGPKSVTNRVRKKTIKAPRRLKVVSSSKSKAT